MVENDRAIDPHISIKKSKLDFIDEYRVGHPFKNRSSYFQHLIDKDITFNKLDHFAELTGLLLLPFIGFLMFLVLAVLTRGMLFYLFMAIFGLFAIMLSFVYYAKNKKPRS